MATPEYWNNRFAEAQKTESVYFGSGVWNYGNGFTNQEKSMLMDAGMSEYGTKNPAEFMAETYTMASNSQIVNSETPPPVVGLMRENFVRWGKIPVIKSQSIVQKGDVDGHPFHGNQYTHGSAEGALMTGEQVKSVIYSPEVVDVFNRIMTKQGFDPYPRNDPMYGGCGVVMKALQNIYPNGKPVALGIAIPPEEGEDNPPVFVDHYALQIGENTFVDAKGERTLEELSTMSHLGKFWVTTAATPEIIADFQSIATCTDQEAKDYANAMLKSSGVDTVVKGDLMGHLFHGNQHMTAEEHSVEADKAGKEAEIHEREAARLEAEGKNTQAVVHGFKSVALRREEARHRGLSQER
jgi:hypothetical protein